MVKQRELRKITSNQYAMMLADPKYKDVEENLPTGWVNTTNPSCEYRRLSNYDKGFYVIFTNEQDVEYWVCDG